MWVLTSTTASQESPITIKQSIAKLRVANESDIAGLSAQPLFAANPETVLPLLSMIGQAQLSIDDFLGQLSRQFIEQMCGKDARVQRCGIHKIRNATDRLPKDRAEQVRWLMKQAFKLDTLMGKQRLKELAKDLKAQHPDAAADVLEGLDKIFTITELGITGDPIRKS